MSGKASQEEFPTKKVWMKHLVRMRKHLSSIIDQEFPSIKIKIEDYLSQRFLGAKEIIIRSDIRFSSLVLKGNSAVALMASTKLLEKGPERIIRLKTYQGEEIELSVGTPPEESFHITQVGPYGFKCTCEDAIMLASKADREFVEGLKRAGILNLSPVISFPLFSRYILCKHTIALLALLLASKKITFRNKEFKKSLKLSLFGIALRVSETGEIEASKFVEIYYSLLSD